MHPRHPLRWQRERCDRGLWEGCSCDTPPKHTQNCGMSRDSGVATPWSATGGGVASAPLRVFPELFRISSVLELCISCRASEAKRQKH